MLPAAAVPSRNPVACRNGSPPCGLLVGRGLLAGLATGVGIQWSSMVTARAAGVTGAARLDHLEQLIFQDSGCSAS